MAASASGSWNRGEDVASITFPSSGVPPVPISNSLGGDFCFSFALSLIIFWSIVVSIPFSKIWSKVGTFCLPMSKVRSMSSSQLRAAVSRKQRAERKPRRGKKPNYART